MLEVDSVCHFLPLNYLRIDPPEPALTSAPFISNSICYTIFSFPEVSLLTDLRTCFSVTHKKIVDLVCKFVAFTNRLN